MSHTNHWLEFLPEGGRATEKMAARIKELRKTKEEYVIYLNDEIDRMEMEALKSVRKDWTAEEILIAQETARTQ